MCCLLYTGSSGKVIVNDELRSMQTEAVVANLKHYPRKCPEHLSETMDVLSHNNRLSCK
jgi:hypothetical protein